MLALHPIAAAPISSLGESARAINAAIADADGVRSAVFVRVSAAAAITLAADELAAAAAVLLSAAAIPVDLDSLVAEATALLGVAGEIVDDEVYAAFLRALLLSAGNVIDRERISGLLQPQEIPIIKVRAWSSLAYRVDLANGVNSVVTIGMELAYRLAVADAAIPKVEAHSMLVNHVTPGVLPAP